MEEVTGTPGAAPESVVVSKKSFTSVAVALLVACLALAISVCALLLVVTDGDDGREHDRGDQMSNGGGQEEPDGDSRGLPPGQEKKDEVPTLPDEEGFLPPEGPPSS